jgi:glycosyltransferase involved in cell wall biosynthesis
MSDFNFFLLGDDLKPLLLPGNVTNYGIVKNENISRYLDEHSIYILPSYTEAFPISILEAMARGMVILIADLPGMDEIVEHGQNGFLFQPGDVQEMKKILHFLKSNPEEVRRISRNNLSRIDRFTGDRVLPAYLTTYEDITS